MSVQVWICNPERGHGTILTLGGEWDRHGGLHDNINTLESVNQSILVRYIHLNSGNIAREGGNIRSWAVENFDKSSRRGERPDDGRARPAPMAIDGDAIESHGSDLSI